MKDNREHQFIHLITTPLESNLNKHSKAITFGCAQESQFGFNNFTWRTSGFRIMTYVLKFINLIVRSYYPQHFQKMNKNLFKIIHDSASEYDFYKYEGLLTTDKPSKFKIILYKNLRCLFGIFYFYKERRKTMVQYPKNQWLLKPDDNFMILWNIYLLIVVTVNVFYVSLRLAFDEIQDSNSIGKEFVLEQLPSYSFVLEILLKFNTCTYSKGMLLTDRQKLIMNYFRGDFAIDIFIVVPFIIGQQFNFRYFDLVIILKVFQISQLTNSLFNKLELTQQQTAVFDLAKFVYLFSIFRSFMILVAHFCACIWHAIGLWGEWGNSNTHTWLKAQQIHDNDWMERYIFSFYWSIVTMTTIGYGDITPVNLSERIFVIFMTMFSTAVFAYSVNNIGQIFKDMSKQSVLFKNNMNSLNKYLKGQHVSSDLQNKFRRYFEYYWNKPSENDVIHFKDLIPQQLKEDMITEMNMQILNQIPFFHQFSIELRHKLCLELKDITIPTDEYLFQRNQKPENLYIQVQGELKYVNKIKNKERVFEIFGSCCLIGQLEFFTNGQYQYDAQAVKNTNILFVNRDKLNQVFKQFPQDYEIFRHIIDEVLQRQQFSLISVKCKACNKDSHFMNNCPLLIGTPNKIKIMMNHKHYVPSDRHKFNRQNHTRKMSARKHKFIVMESMIQYLMKNEDTGILDRIQEQLQTAIHQLHEPRHAPIPPLPLARTVSYHQEVFKQNGGLPDSLTKRSVHQIKQFKLFANQVDDELQNESQQNKGEDDQSLVVGYESRLPMPKLRKASEVRLKFDDESEEELNGDKLLRGQYEDLFQNFERVKEFNYYQSKNNVNNILEIVNQQIKEIPIRKSRRQATILSLLQKTQRRN